MPLWQIYHPENAFSVDDKSAIAQRATALYEKFLPRFYVNVMFVTASVDILHWWVASR
jgi:phenylpyruvate tautomerase PptA (4-oxalocrotonate tautomerase family)